MEFAICWSVIAVLAVACIIGIARTRTQPKVKMQIRNKKEW